MEIYGKVALAIVDEGTCVHYTDIGFGVKRQNGHPSGAVAMDNSRMLYEALQAYQVATEYLELPSGGHGLNGSQGPMWDAWQAKSLQWLAAQKMIP